MTTSAAALRLKIEHAFENRFPSALTPVPRTIRDVVSTRIAEVDNLLGGGIPVGAISELTGGQSSGRTSLALSIVAQRTNTEQVCAWIDADDTFDPESAEASGISLDHLLWVRCQNRPPRNLATKSYSSRNSCWTRLDQSLRATDLLLQAGGFATIVLDLGNTAPEHGRRIPLATWFRFRQAADQARCSLVVLSKAAYAQSSAALLLECSPAHAISAGGIVLRGFAFDIQQQRQRFTPGVISLRKPPASTWSAGAQWETEMRR
jgi:hypothetical protein